MQTTTRPKTPPIRVVRDDGSLEPAADGVSDAHALCASELPRDLAVAIYEHMVVSRVLDARLVGLQRDGVVTQHTSATGEEAAIVGAAAALADEDWVFPGPREFAAALWRGMPLVAYAHHVLGTARGGAKGRDVAGGPFWRAARVASVGPLSGTHVPHAVGLAWAARLRRDPLAALAYFGDGATSTNDFHAALNFAGVFRAPVVALCRNNGWATSLPVARQTGADGIAVKALAYGVAFVRVDGNDAVAVLEVVRRARERAVSGAGATLVEAVTRPVDAPDAQSSTEPAAHDPILRMRRYLEMRGFWNDDRERELRDDVEADVDRAIAEARRAPAPDVNTLADDVFADVPEHLRRELPQRGSGP